MKAKIKLIIFFIILLLSFVILNKFDKADRNFGVIEEIFKHASKYYNTPCLIYYVYNKKAHDVNHISDFTL